MMKIQYLETGSDDCPLIRLFGFEESDVASLRDVCLSLAVRRVLEFSLDSQAWVESVGDCRVILRSADRNKGARWGKHTGDPFAIEFDSEGWLEVADKILPFIADHKVGFQWLTEEGDFKVLLSWDGLW